LNLHTQTETEKDTEIQQLEVRLYFLKTLIWIDT
jgi:hypothetical protein